MGEPHGAYRSPCPPPRQQSHFCPYHMYGVGTLNYPRLRTRRSTTEESMVLSGWDLFWPVIAAVGAAVLVGGTPWIWVAAGRKAKVAPRDQVKAGSAWAPQDSWITNTGTITG